MKPIKIIKKLNESESISNESIVDFIKSNYGFNVTNLKGSLNYYSGKTVQGMPEYIITYLNIAKEIGLDVDTVEFGFPGVGDNYVGNSSMGVDITDNAIDGSPLLRMWINGQDGSYDEFEVEETARYLFGSTDIYTSDYNIYIADEDEDWTIQGVKDEEAAIYYLGDNFKYALGVMKDLHDISLNESDVVGNNGMYSVNCKDLASACKELSNLPSYATNYEKHAQKLVNKIYDSLYSKYFSGILTDKGMSTCENREQAEKYLNKYHVFECLDMLSHSGSHNLSAYKDISVEDIKNALNAELDKFSNTNESSLTESRYSDIEETDPVLDKTIKVYDINAFIDKEINPDSDVQYKAFDFDGGVAIIVKSDGSGVIADYEGVGYSFNSTSEEKPVYICPKDEDDGSGHRTIHIMATASFKATVDELMQAPSKEMKVKDFFTKWNYNDRCARNFENIKPYLTESAKLNESHEEFDYIDGANYKKYGYNEIYNSQANTDVMFILQELKTYFDESIVCAEDIIKNANHDPGIYDSDVEMLQFCSEKVTEMINKMNSTWE